MVSKFKNKKVTLDGISFDSVKEARRYQELKLMEQAGKIEKLRLQVPFLLIPAQYRVINGKRRCVERACQYIADFTYFEGNELVVEDTKGFKTPEYKIKRKLMLYIRGLQIKEV